MELTGEARYTERGREAHVRGNGADRSAPPSRGREGAGTRKHGLAPTGRVRLSEGECGRVDMGQARLTGLSWAKIVFPFSFPFEFLIPFLFIFSMEFKSNQSTISNSNISNMCINQKESLSSA